MSIRLLKEIYYRGYCIINRVIPKNDKFIFFYDSTFQRQNCWALFQYMVNNKINDTYKLFYYTEKKYTPIDTKKNNVVIVKSFIRGWWYHLRAKYTFYEYANNKFVSTSVRGQVNFNIWHGMPLKKIGYPAGERPPHKYARDFDYVLATSDFYSKIIQKCFGCSSEQIYIGGYPRNDQLFSSKELFPFFRKDSHNILWMPTFRKSNSNRFDDSDIPFPLIKPEELVTFDKWLGKANVKLLIKLHPFQNNVPWLTNEKFDNIKAVYNDAIFDKGYELYDVVGQADLLITDYSSVYIDYLLLNRPIIFTDDDIEEYKRKRGFLFDNIEEYLPGPLVSNVDELCVAISEILNNDIYSDRRLAVKKQFIANNNINFSKSIVEFLGIKEAEDEKQYTKNWVR